MRYIDSPTYLASQDEMSALFPDLTDALENTYKIADSCDLSLELGKSFYPQVDLPKMNSPTSFKELAHEKVGGRYQKLQTKYLSV